MRNRVLFIVLLINICFVADARYVTKIKVLENEHWWGLATALGKNMPFSKNFDFDLLRENKSNQIAPLLVSDKGRYVWSEYPYTTSFRKDSIIICSDFEEVVLNDGGKTLKDAYLNACSKHFPPSHKIPNELFFSKPQYNTWIELLYNQNQKDILDYAQNIVDNGMPPGIIMIDDNWQCYYGNFDFKPGRFPDPKYMVKKLHEMGFKVMLWISPFVSADSRENDFLKDKGYLIKDKRDKWNGFYPAIVQWWNGQSTCFDLTNDKAMEYLLNTLNTLHNDYGIDGFKFDAGDNIYYNDSNMLFSDKNAISTDHTLKWAELGLKFGYNEYRACWKMGGRELVQRLGDKASSWEALQLLIPEMISAGIIGYSYTCPDMIGGGSFASFMNVDPSKLDQELIVRSAQVHAVMPMMQFSVAPWRVLSEQNFNIVKQAVKVHTDLSEYILSCAKNASTKSEPIVRCMEYAFPNQGLESCSDQYMLGEKYLMAPMVYKGEYRDVVLPKGKWKDETGKKYKGGKTYKIYVPLSRIPVFEKI